MNIMNVVNVAQHLEASSNLGLTEDRTSLVLERILQNELSCLTMKTAAV